jgi:hypothetical protein
MTELLKIIIKSIEESIRMTTLSKFGYQQLQIELTYLIQSWSNILSNNDNFLESNIKHILQTDAKNRCIDENPALDDETIQKYF